MKRLRIAAIAITSVAMLFACSTTDLVVGDDSPTLPPNGSPDPDPNPNPNGLDAAPLNDGGGGGGDGGGKDAKTDAPPTCAAPATCIPSSEVCKTLANNGKGCASTNQVCCAQTCPQLSPPAPTFCDGGPYAPLYDATSKCVIGYACAPVACSTAGGQCVGLAPSSCPNGNWGTVDKYSCGGGLGTGCCLP